MSSQYNSHIKTRLRLSAKKLLLALFKLNCIQTLTEINWAWLHVVLHGSIQAHRINIPLPVTNENLLRFHFRGLLLRKDFELDSFKLLRCLPVQAGASPSDELNKIIIVFVNAVARLFWQTYRLDELVKDEIVSS